MCLLDFFSLLSLHSAEWASKKPVQPIFLSVCGWISLNVKSFHKSIFAFESDGDEWRKRKNEIIECKFRPAHARTGALCVSCMEIYGRLKHNIET